MHAFRLGPANCADSVRASERRLRLRCRLCEWRARELTHGRSLAHTHIRPHKHTRTDRQTKATGSSCCELQSPSATLVCAMAVRSSESSGLAAWLVWLCVCVAHRDSRLVARPRDNGNRLCAPANEFEIRPCDSQVRWTLANSFPLITHSFACS